MAKKSKGRRRNSKNFVAIPFQTAITLSTLGDGALALVDVLGATFGEDFYAISVEAVYSLLGNTAGEGPLVIGYAHGDLSDTEIAECLNAELTDPDDIIQKERSRRPVRRTGIFSGVTTDETLNQGVPLKTPLKMSVGEGFDLEFWCENLSGNALAGGASVRAVGTLYGRWQR